jgi:hypothetical protein
MTSGGARARSGPPPDPAALRRDRKTDAAWTMLPAQGREGDPPAWPLTAGSAREAELWGMLWRTPQAAQWDRLGQVLEVALYVRRLAEAEEPGSATALGTLVRQMADALGLTIPGLRVNRWKIATDEVAAKREQKAAAAVAVPSARNRFAVIDGSGEAGA